MTERFTADFGPIRPNSTSKRNSDLIPAIRVKIRVQNESLGSLKVRGMNGGASVSPVLSVILIEREPNLQVTPCQAQGLYSHTQSDVKVVRLASGKKKKSTASQTFTMLANLVK